jgi:hypothetical protein
VTEPAPESLDGRILETLQQILAVQTEQRDHFQQVQRATEAQISESLALQREAAARSAIAVETQRRSARLYRYVVLVAGALVLAGLICIAYIAIVG